MRVELAGLSARHPAAKPGAPAALRSLTLGIAPGEQVAVIGPSGAGKTTFLHALACALRPEGTLQLGGQNPWLLGRSQLQKLRSHLCLAPQVPPLPPRQRVVTATLAGALPRMGLLASLKSLFYPQNIPAAHAALLQFDVAEKIFERVDRLSGGERQRVGLARMLVSDAQLWLVDEPLSALDPARASQALLALVQGAKAKGATLVCSLHQVERATAMFPRVIGLRDGQLAFDLPSSAVTKAHLAALYAQHEHELAAPAPNLVDAPATAAPAVMHCR
jgi:phosphonate transport system ATP-binding protein